MLKAWTTVVMQGAPCFFGTLITWGQPLATPADWTLRVVLAWILPGSIGLGLWRRWCHRGHRMAGWWALLLSGLGWWLIYSHLMWTAFDGRKCWTTGALVGVLVLAALLVLGGLGGRGGWSARPWLIGLVLLIAGLLGVHQTSDLQQVQGSTIVYAVGAIILSLGWFVGREVWTVRRWGLGFLLVVAGWFVVWPHAFINPFGSLSQGQCVAEDELQEVWEVMWPARLAAGGQRYRFTLGGYYMAMAVAVDVEVHADGTGTLTVHSVRSPSNCEPFSSCAASDGHVSLAEQRELTRRQVDDISSGFERSGFWHLASEPVMRGGRWSGRRLGSGGLYHGPEWGFRAVRGGSPELSLEMASHFSGSYLSASDKAAWRKLSKLAITMLQLSEIRIEKKRL